MILRVVVFYVLTWFFLMLLGGVQQATGVLPAEIGLAQWGPGVAGLLMLLLFRKDGQKMTWFSRNTPLVRYVYAALIPVGVALVVFAMRSWIPMQAGAAPAAYNSLLLLILWMPLGALGEEIGWRGYLHKKLNGRIRGLVSSLLVGVLWMPIHVHFFAQGPVFLLFLALLLISYSIVIYALVQDTGFSVILAAVFHLAINLSNLLFLDVINSLPFMMVNAITWAVVAAIVVWKNKGLFFAGKP